VNDLTPLRQMRAPPDAVTVETVRGLDGFARLQPEWNSLFHRWAAPHQIFQSHAFLSAWVEAYANDGAELAVVTFRLHSRLVAVIPLVRRHWLGVDVLQFMGAPVSQFDDMLVDADLAGYVLARIPPALAELGADLLEARRIREDSALWRIPAGMPFVFERMEAPFADLAARVEDSQPGQVYSSRDRSNYRRRLRRLCEARQAPVSFDRSGREAADLAGQAVAMKTAALRRDGVDWETVGCSKFRDFFCRLAHDPRWAAHFDHRTRRAANRPGPFLPLQRSASAMCLPRMAHSTRKVLDNCSCTMFSPKRRRLAPVGSICSHRPIRISGTTRTGDASGKSCLRLYRKGPFGRADWLQAGHAGRAQAAAFDHTALTRRIERRATKSGPFCR
jgi:hypothetical protein